MTDREFIKRLADKHNQKLDDTFAMFSEDDMESAESFFGHGDDCLDAGFDFGNNEIYALAKQHLELTDAI